MRGRESRLRKRKDFLAVTRRGTSSVNRLMVLRAMPNDLPYSRAGVVVSKRLGKAVTRNKVKRRIKEALGPISINPGWDLVLIARVPAAEADFHEISQAVAQLLNRGKVLMTSDQTEKRGIT